MTDPRRLSPLLLMLTGLAALAALVLVPWVLQAQSQEVTQTADATGGNPPAKPTNLQASAEHDEVVLTWTASSDQTVTHYAVLRRNRDTDTTGVFHVIESNAGPGTSYTDGSVAASSRYNYRVKSVSPTGVSPVVGLRSSRHPRRAGADAYTDADAYTGTRAGIHVRRPGPHRPDRRACRRQWGQPELDRPGGGRR